MRIFGDKDMDNKFSKKCFCKGVWIILMTAVFAVSVVLCGAFFEIFEEESEEFFYGSELKIKEFAPLVVAEGLQITAMGDYSGIYLEDGSDEVVSSVMMVVLENISDRDLQLARIKVVYTEYVAEFEATNLPSGDSVTLLEKNRRQTTEDNAVKFSAENIVFFEQKMDTMEDIFEVISGDGFVEIKNKSNKDIDGTTMIYYKNKAGDTLYGGITYRAGIEDTIPSGKSVRVLTNHFTEKNTKIMQIVNVK